MYPFARDHMTDCCYNIMTTRPFFVSLKKENHVWNVNIIWCTSICISICLIFPYWWQWRGGFRSPVSLFVYTIFSILNLWSLIAYWVLRSYILYLYLSDQLFSFSAPMNDRLWWQIIPITNPLRSWGSLLRDGPCVQIGKNTRTRLPMTKRDMKT